ncbi:hypothetical protein GYA28_03145 [Candidatus Roizmanbacteria bacterium]|nr:hypothetical protein [Candidatus Roizmanbacteria bacterium]
MKKISAILIFALAFLMRFYGFFWDEGYHFHPDERMLILVAERIDFFKNLNPNFFNYGSLPIYLLKGSSQLIDLVFKTNLANYQGMLVVGRSLSIVSDLITLIIVYRISSLLFEKHKHVKLISLLTLFSYTLSFFPIQNSHFFVVDVFLNLFVCLTAYSILKYLKKPKTATLFLMAVAFAAALTVKITALVILPLIILFIFLTSPKKIVANGLFFLSTALVFSFIFMPYAFLNFPRFIFEVKNQLQMNIDAYVFPYTLQYVGTTPYLYYVKNIFFWGMGPILSLLSLYGAIMLLREQSYKKNVSKNLVFVLVFFYLFYFLLIGRSAVKFMRYLLPLYPFLAIMAGYGLLKFSKNRLSLLLLLSAMFLWSMTFVNIYTHRHTRLEASRWIAVNIPPGSTLAVEHWDDLLPVYDTEKYSFVTLNLYDRPDDAKNKWLDVEKKLSESDYLIIASNRLYTPLIKLGDCQRYQPCYPKTKEYYDKLFSGKLGFEKIAEFVAYPYLNLGPWRWQIKDDWADESFTVYDHPKIMIFKKSDLADCPGKL